MLELECQIDAEDYVAFSDYYYRHTRAGRRATRRFIYIAGALFVVFAAVEASDPERGFQNPVQFALYLLVLLLMLAAVYWLFLRWFLPTLARAQVRFGPRRRLLAPTTYTFCKAEVRVATPEGRGRIGWEDIAGIAATHTHLFVLLSGKNAFILPKHCFESAAKAEEVRATLERWHAASSVESGGD